MFGRFPRGSTCLWYGLVLLGLAWFMETPRLYGQDQDSPNEEDPFAYLTTALLPPPGGAPNGPEMSHGLVWCPPVHPYRRVATTMNQRSVGIPLDSLAGPVAPATANLLLQIQGLSVQDRPAQLQMLSGESYATAQSLGQQIGEQSLRVIASRLINNDLLLNEGDSMLLGAAEPSLSTDSVVRGQHGMKDVYGWVQGFGTSGDLSSDGNAAGLDFGSGGIAFGIDLGRDDSSLIGIAGAFSNTTMSSEIGDAGQISSGQISLYGLQRYEEAYGFFVLNYGNNQNEVSRMIQVGNVNAVARGDFTGHQFGSYGELGLNLDGPILRFQPLMGLQYVLVSNDSVSESGGGGAALNVAAANLSTFQFQMGARLIAHGLVDRRGRVWTPYVNGRWSVDLIGESATASASLAGAPGAAWTVWGNQPGRNFGQIGPGLTLQVNRWLTLFGNYDYQWGSRYGNHVGSGGVVFLF